MPKNTTPPPVYTSRQRLAILITSVLGVLAVAGVIVLALGVSGQLPF